jgi:hypothetical protein
MASESVPVPRKAHRHSPVFGTLLPHLGEERHHLYRDITALALLASLIAAGCGSLPAALVLAAVALPAAVLVYVHDHRLWHDEPLTVIAVSFLLSLLLGVGVGLLETRFVTLLTSGSTRYQLPPVDRLLQLGLLVPLAAFVAAVIAPLVVSTRPAFRHRFDIVVAGTLSGAALSLGLSLVVQHGAFTHLQATAGDPAHVAFIAVTLGFLQPIILATAATVAVLGIRRLGTSPVTGVLTGLFLVVVYELATTVLQPYGTRGLVLTALAAFVVADLGLVATRRALHVAALDDTETEALGAGHAEHRLHGGLVAGVIAVVVLLAAVASVTVVLSRTATHPVPPGQEGSNGVSSHKASTTGATHPATGRSGEPSWGSLTLASTSSSLAVGTATTINLANGVSVEMVPGWVIGQQGKQVVLLYNSDKSAAAVASAGNANTPDITQESAFLINSTIKGDGLTNVVQNAGPPKPLQGQNFQQLLEVDYTADVQTDQGTGQVYGGWVTLYNASTHTSGWLNYFAGSQNAFKASLEDAGRILASME